MKKNQKEQKLTGFASIDNPQSQEAHYFERNPIIPNVNIYTLLKLLSMRRMDDIAVDCLDLKACYKDLVDDAVTISLALKELGVKKGDIVAIAMPNLYQGLAAYFACNRIGAVTTYLDAFSPVEEISTYLNLFESPVLINFDKNEEYNKKIKDETKVKHIITLDRKNVNELSLQNNYHITSSDNKIDFNSLDSIAQFHSMKEDSLILFTSGSTGIPKSVVLTNENILAAEIYAMNTSHTENITGKSTLTCVPFCYPYGLVTSALTSLLWGKEAILAPDISKDTVSYYYGKKPSIVFGSPALLNLTMNYIPRHQDLSSVTHFISGGDFLTPSHAQRGTEFFKEHGADKIEIGNGFGNAETVSIGSTPVGVPLRQETAGKILVGTTAMIVDPDTLEEKKYGEEGLFCVAGRHVFKGYYKNEELTRETKFERDGKEYYKTGTLGRIDEEGYFHITGRQSRFYITSSLNKVYCDKVQGLISKLDEVRDCAVVKVQDDEKLYVNKAYIVLNNPLDQTEEMKELLYQRFQQPMTSIDGQTLQLKPYEVPTYIEFIDEMPRLAGSEKIDYSYLERDAQSKKEAKNFVLKK